MPADGFSVDVVRGVPVVTAPEDVDVTNAGSLRVALLEAARDGHKRVVVDLTRTQFCDSAALHALVTAHRRARDEDRELLVAASSATVLRVLALTGLDRVITAFGSLDEALQHTAAAAGGSQPASPA